jgi:Protein of unknown function (DUF2442)
MKMSKVGAAKPVKSRASLPRIKTAEFVIHGVLKIRWRDNYEGFVDLRPIIARGNIFTLLQNAKKFQKFEIDEFGHSLGWSFADGTTIDFSAENLRERAERQAAILQLAS